MSQQDDVRHLLDLEAIKALKGKYFLYLDTKDWEAWRELFTEDFVAEGTRQPPGAGRDVFVDGVKAALEGVQTCHHGHTPIFQLTGPDSARGVWAMSDELLFPNGHPWSEGHRRRVGYGHYEEEYRRDGSEWRISFLRLVRLWVWRDGDRPMVEGGIPSSGRSWLEQGRK